MSREDPQLRIRLPVELKEKIEKSAKDSSRSMNAEIIEAIELWLKVKRNLADNPPNLDREEWTFSKDELLTMIESVQASTIEKVMSSVETKINGLLLEQGDKIKADNKNPE